MNELTADIVVFIIQAAVLLAVCFATWPSKKHSPLHLLWLLPVGCVLYVLALSLVQPG